MRRTIHIAIFALLLMVLAACGGSSGGSNEANPDDNSGITATDPNQSFPDDSNQNNDPGNEQAAQDNNDIILPDAPNSPDTLASTALIIDYLELSFENLVVQIDSDLRAVGRKASAEGYLSSGRFYIESNNSIVNNIDLHIADIKNRIFDIAAIFPTSSADIFFLIILYEAIILESYGSEFKLRTTGNTNDIIENELSVIRVDSITNSFDQLIINLQAAAILDV